MSEYAKFWEERYAERDRIWSGRPNQALVDVVADLTPGRALDLGCGEGADAIWLAERGWQVTAVDVSATAISRAQQEAAGRGIADDRIEWVVTDLRDWRPDATYDLVTAFFLHSRVAFPRDDVLRTASTAVAPDGHLLVVSHAEPPPWFGHQHDHDHEPFPQPEDEIATLGLAAPGWQVEISEVRDREATGPDGEAGSLRDTVVFARRVA